jgi:CHAD domain-containing protein
MSKPPAELRVPDGMTLADMHSRLSPLYRVRELAPVLRERTYLDSFDWRLHRAGRVLEHRREDGAAELCWRREGGAGRRLAAQAAPAFSRELPLGPLREALERILEMRRLLPQARLQGPVQRLSLQDGAGHTVLRLELEEAHCLGPDGAPRGPLAPRLRLLPVRGHAAEAGRATQTLGRPPPAQPDLYREALAVLGLRPGDYATKPELRLDPAAPAGLATRQIQLALLGVIEANLPGARAALDPEFLHDLRVATRRTRSALGQLRGVFPDAEVERFKAGLAWLQQVTGPTRDLDVHLLALAGYRAALPPELCGDLDPLESYLRSHQGQAQAAMAQELGSPRLQGLLADWRAFLEGPPDAAAGRHAERPVRKLADGRLRRLHRRMLEQGRAITEGSPPEALHKLRKTCKKLRYLLELVAGLYEPAQVRGLVKRLKGLLDNLGAFQDLAVQARTLRELGTRLLEEGSGGPATLLALGALVAQLSERQQTERERFARVFGDFDQVEERRLFKALLGSWPRPRAGRGADPP